MSLELCLSGIFTVNTGVKLLIIGLSWLSFYTFLCSGQNKTKSKTKQNKKFNPTYKNKQNYLYTQEVPRVSVPSPLKKKKKKIY